MLLRIGRAWWECEGWGVHQVKIDVTPEKKKSERCVGCFLGWEGLKRMTVEFILPQGKLWQWRLNRESKGWWSNEWENQACFGELMLTSAVGKIAWDSAESFEGREETSDDDGKGFLMRMKLQSNTTTVTGKLGWKLNRKENLMWNWGSKREEEK